MRDALFILTAVLQIETFLFTSRNVAHEFCSCLPINAKGFFHCSVHMQGKTLIPFYRADEIFLEIFFDQ